MAERGATAAPGPNVARWLPAICSIAACLPAFASSPGRMPADTKLALYLDPWRLTTEAPATFDAAQYAGWVPHQQIAYLWPSGPWYSLFEVLAVPDWVAHRLWISTLLALAGTGVGWALRTLGCSPPAVVAGALVYQLSPYALPYVSRTSSLLLPVAALGWICTMTLLASRDATRWPWRWPAAIALVVATVGAVNATALLMIVPAPVLMLVYARVAERAPWRRLAAIAGLTSLACAAVSAWWVAMLLVQRDNGPDVLAYSEGLRAVSASSTSLEVLRGLGYWLFYVRDHVGGTTTASLDHLTSVPVIVLGFTAAALPLVGLIADRSPRARLGAWCVAVGAIVAVGVHPIADPSPLVQLLGGDLDGGLALALRSATRAVPVLVFGLAIGTACLVEAAPWPRSMGRHLGANRSLVVAVAVVGIAFAATPSWWSGSLVDPNLDRDAEPPPAWRDAATQLTAEPTTGRVLQLPGAEFGAFEWGVTVDQPLPYLTDRGVVTRDLLPLGSPAAMDLIWALDDRAQDGTLEPGSIGPVARWLGVDNVWLAGDLDVERYDTARPPVIAAALETADLGATLGFGEPLIAGRSVIDDEFLGLPAARTPIEPVRLVTLNEPGSIVRVRTGSVVLAGSGAGLVDAAAAGLLDGTEVVLAAATIDPSSQPVERLIVTDSFRDRARHWRSSQDTLGFTESGDEASDLLRDDDADERLPIFDGATDRTIDDADRTIAEQIGPVTATATAYGEPFAYLPEHRPAMAVDGDRSTSWLVGEHADPIGERLRLELAPDIAADRLIVRQATEIGDRTITSISVDVDGDRFDVGLDERSWSDDGQPIDVVVSGGGVVELTIASVSPGRPNAVGFAEVDLGLGPTTEWVRPPTRLPHLADDGRLEVVLTRLRAEATDRWRDDPEPVLRRIVTVPDSLVGHSSEATLTIRLDPRASDAAIAAAVGANAIASDRVTGSLAARGDAAVDGDDSTAWITPFGAPIGPRLTLTGLAGSTDRLGLRQPDGPYSTITLVRLEDAAGAFDVSVMGDELPLPRPVDLSTLTITIADVDPHTVVDRRFGDTVLAPAAIAELELGDGAIRSTERREPASSDCGTGWISVDGVQRAVSFEADAERLLSGAAIEAVLCESVTLDDELRVEADGSAPFNIDRVVLVAGPETPAPAPVDWIAPTGSDPRSVVVDGCPDGCWIILGQGFNPAWAASANGVSLGVPQLVDGNANGWWLAPADEPVEVRFEWTAQRPVTIALFASFASVLALAVALLIGRRSRATTPAAAVDLETVIPGRAALPTLIVGYAILAAGLIDLTAGVVATAIGGLVWLTHRRHRPTGRLVALTAVLALAAMSVIVAVIVWREAPFPGLGWPERFERWHRPGLLAVFTIAFGLEAAASRRSARPTGREGTQ